MRSRAALLSLALPAALLVAGPAAATTMCVPSFHPACPSSGGNVAVAQLQTALQTDGDDTMPDRIVIAAGTVSHTDTYALESGDNDDLEVVGAGPGATFVTISDNGNQFVMNLNGARDVTMRDLTIRVPASFPDGGGGGLQSEQDTFENVDIESLNPGSDGASSVIGGGTFRDGRIYGSNGGSIDVGIGTNGAETGSLLIERTSIEDASWGIHAHDPEVAVHARRVAIRDPLAYGVRISEGGFLVFENGIVESTTATPVVAASTDAATVIATVRHSTIVGIDPEPGDHAIEAVVNDGAGNGGVNLVVTDTIVSGYDDPLLCSAPSSPSIGNASLSVTYSYFLHSAETGGDCTLFNANTIDAADPQVGPPQFAGPGDYRLPLGSPAIDSGNPLTVTLPTVDFLGAPRPVDGDADGEARRDMGAYEYQPPTQPPPGGGGGPGGGGPVKVGPAPAAKTPTFGAKPLVTLALARKRIGAGQRLKVRIANRNAFAITGTVRGKRFQVRAGGRATVAVKLSRRLRGRLVRDGKLALRLTAIVRSPAGDTRSVKRRLTVRLKLPAKKG